MAGRGPVPKDPEKASRRRPTMAMHEIPRGARVDRAPRLPPPADEREWNGIIGAWHPLTVQWYRRWARSEQATQFSSVMWGRLHDMAYLVDNYYRDPDAKLFTEIRLNEAKLGATPEDMQRLRWRIVDAPEPEHTERRRSRSGRDPRHLTAVPDPT